MKITGEYRIAAPRERVWEAINDPAVLRRCIPGCEEIVRNTPTDWTARVTAKVGPVKARFTGNIRLEDLDPPAGCRIAGEGSGGAAGFAQGGATVRLAENGADATVLTYDADAQIGGKLAQIGSRLIDSFARRYADDFFAEFARVVGGEADGESHVAAPKTDLHPAEPMIDPSPGPNAQALGATAVLAPVEDPRASPAVASQPSDSHPPAPTPSPPSSRGFDSQGFTIVVLALLLVFMTIMYALKP